MSDDGEHRDTESADPGPKWVWLSTEESVEHGTISVLACAEVAAGIWLYWWFLPWWLETNLHLLISVLVAPLLLLRSPASVAAALAAFQRSALRGDKYDSFYSKLGTVSIILAAGLSALVSWGLAETWLSGQEGWSLFWRAGVITWISVQIGIAGGGALAGAAAGAGLVAGAGAGAVAGAVAIAIAIAGAGAGAVAAATAVAVAVAVAGTVALLAGSGVVAGAVAAALVGPATLLGYWLRSVIVRIGSTLRHWKEGWRRLSVNWRSLVWAHDLRRPPELLPGIHRHPELSDFGIGKILNLYKSDSGAKRVFWIFMAATSLPIFFLPAWLYRLSLKSTCWFWWPLVFFQTSGRTAAREVAEDGTPGAEVVFAEQTEPLWAMIQFALAVALLVVAFGVPQDWLGTLPVPSGSIALLVALGDMIYLMLPCAAAQFALFLLCGRYLARAKAVHLGSGPRTAFLWLFNLRQLSLGIGLVAALVLLLENWVPVLTPFAELVETHYFSWFPLLARP